MAVMTDSTELGRLFETGAHFAQVKSRRHPSMKGFVVGAKGGHEIIDLTKTESQLGAAKAVLEAMVREGKTVLFVGGKIEVAQIVKKAAESIGAPYVTTRWLGGTISNWSEIKKRIDRLADLTEKAAAGTLAKQHTKLEVLRLEREKTRLEERLDGITSMVKHPDLLVVVDSKHERHAIKEARDARIPVVALMSSDCNLSDATYPIVANDSSRETVRLVLSELTSAYVHGRAV